jgi:hypothetical protein
MILVVFAAALLIVLPVQAHGHTPTGPRINLNWGPTTFPAGEPFHITHGWYMMPSEDAPVGLWNFELEVDGVPMKPTFRWIEAYPADPSMGYPTWLVRTPVFNFPDGMEAGSYTFTGHNYAPCEKAVEYGLYPGPCSTPNEKIVTLTRTLTVEFYE